MKKSHFFVSLFLLVMCIMPCLFLQNGKSFAKNEQNNIIEISSLAELTNPDNFEKKFKLTSDIDLSQDVWTPIGWQESTKTYKPFKGELDGNGFKISGIKLENAKSYNVGLFGILENATIKNLKLEVSSIACSDVEDVTVLNIGALAGQIKSSQIQNCYVEFCADDSIQNQFFIANKTTDQGLTTFAGLTNSISFGGFAGVISEGTSFQNCQSKTKIKVLKDASQGKNINIGGVAGDCNFSQITNTTSKLDAKIDVENDKIDLATNVGGVCANVCGEKSKIQNCYAQTNVECIQEFSSTNFGAIAGNIDLSFAPKAKNIDYIYATAKFKQNNASQVTNIIGKQNNYSLSNCKSEVLTENDFAMFKDSNYWQTDKMWDFDNVWSATGDDFPVLQVFKTYTIDLNTNPMVDFGLLTNADKNVSSISFENDNSNQKQYKFGEIVKINIKIAEKFKKYFDLDTISVSNTIVYNSKSFLDNNSNFTVEKPSDDLSQDGAKDFYTISYRCSDTTSGQVSFSLSKIAYTLNVSTEDSLMGNVRNQFSSSSLDQFEQSITYGNKYIFLAVPASNDFAFLKWCFEYENDEQNTDLTTSSSSYAFVFGSETQTDEIDFNAHITSGAKLVAHWTSNVCKIQIQVKDGNTILEDGFVLKDKDGNKIENIVSVQKGEYTLSVELDEKYVIDGWYSQYGNLLGNSTTLKSETDGEEMIIVLKVSRQNKIADLTWLWITLGSIGGAGLITVVIVIIVKKSKDSAYKNFY